MTPQRARMIEDMIQAGLFRSEDADAPNPNRTLLLITDLIETRRDPLARRAAGRHPFRMFFVTEADADATRAIFNQDGELSAAIELRRRFPRITDNAKARAHVRTIAGSKPPPSQPCTVTGMRSSIRRGRHTHHHQQPDSPVTALARGAGGSPGGRCLQKVLVFTLGHKVVVVILQRYLSHAALRRGKQPCLGYHAKDQAKEFS